VDFPVPPLEFTNAIVFKIAPLSRSHVPTSPRSSVTTLGRGNVTT
jgi:hypothetical protein